MTTLDPKKKIVKDELWRRGELSWKLHKGQTKVHQRLSSLSPKVREVVILISRRWGKSYMGVIMALMDCLKKEGRQVFIVGPNLKQTIKIITPLIQEISADAPDGLIKRTKSEQLWTVGKSTLMIGAFDTAIESFRGLKADAIYLEESALADSQDYEYILRSVLRPTLMHSRGKIYHLTTPSKEVDHPFHTVTIPEAEANASLFTYTIYDNPLLTKEDISEEIRVMGGEDSIHCRRELFCEIVKDTESLIVPEFSDRNIKEIVQPKHTNHLMTIDFGGSRDNHALLLLYFDFERAKICVIDEAFLEVNTGTEKIVEVALDMEKRNNVSWEDGPKRIIDAPGQTHVDIKRLGFSCSPPLKGRDSVLEGVNALRVAVLNDEIEVHPRCVNLAAAMKHGRWDKHKKDFMRSKALGHCDMIAAMIYGLRHINKYSNPIPRDGSIRPHTHYIPKTAQDIENEKALGSAFGII